MSNMQSQRAYYGLSTEEWLLGFEVTTEEFNAVYRPAESDEPVEREINRRITGVEL